MLSKLDFVHIVLAPIYMLVFISALNSSAPVGVASTLIFYVILQAAIVIIFLFMRLIRVKNDVALFFSTAAFLVFFSYDVLRSFGCNEVESRWYLYGVGWVIFWGCICANIKKICIHKLNGILSVSLLLLIAVNLYSILSARHVFSYDNGIERKVKNNILNNTVDRPIFHIYLDGFARKDIMESIYGEKSYYLEDSLKKLGFYIVGQSNTNYTETVYSIGSALNMDYLDNYREEQNIKAHRDVLRSIGNGRVLGIMKGLGYHTVAFKTGANYDMASAVDKYIDPLKNKIEKKFLLSSIYYRVLRSKALFWPTSVDKRLPFRHAHYARELSIFDHVERSPSEGKNYYFVHFVCPHPPFVFDESGKYAEDNLGKEDISDGFPYTEGDPDRVNNYRKLYRRQAVFIAHRVVALVKTLLQRSEVKPIIIIQSDHGPGSSWNRKSLAETNIPERISIVNAYYFPEKELKLSPFFSPVNTYRLLFNLYFKGNYNYLPDKTFFLEADNYVSLPNFIEVAEHKQRMGQ